MLQIPAYQKQPGFFGNPSHGSGWDSLSFDTLSEPYRTVRRLSRIEPLSLARCADCGPQTLFV